ncbi:MAG: hypothetical protein QMB94_11525 [Phycisphaerales bacterium]
MSDSTNAQGADRGLADLRRRMHERLLDSMDFGAAIQMSREQLFVECSNCGTRSRFDELRQAVP